MEITTDSFMQRWVRFSNIRSDMDLVRWYYVDIRNVRYGGIRLEGGKFEERFEQKKTQPNVYPVLGWLCAVVSLIFFPLLVGAAGVVFGYLAKSLARTSRESQSWRYQLLADFWVL